MNNHDSNQLHKASREEQEYSQDAYQIKTDATVTGQRALYDQTSNPAQYTGVDTQTSQPSHGLPGPEAPFPLTQSVLNQDVLVPALDYNGYVLYASSRPVPEELIREPTGGSIAEPGAVLDEENGRTYVDHETGRYFLPNDPVCKSHTQRSYNLARCAADGDLPIRLSRTAWTSSTRPSRYTWRVRSIVLPLGAPSMCLTSPRGRGYGRSNSLKSTLRRR